MEKSCKKISPKHKLVVQFSGECGTDSGAISKEFLTLAVNAIKEELFPGGCPTDSMLNVHNGTFLQLAK